MISEIRLRDFKNFQDAHLAVGKFTVVVGTNASGKSNIRDVFRFLHGIGRGYSLAEIIGGRYGAGGQAEWAQMRGAASEIIRFDQSRFQIDVKFQFHRRVGNYHIAVERSEQGRGGFRVVEEWLRGSWETIYTSHPGEDDPVHAQDDDTHLALRMAKMENQRKFGYKILVRPDQPGLSQIGDFKNAGRAHKERAQELLDMFAGIRFLDLVPDLMRKPAFPGQVILGDSGENLPTALQAICSDPTRKSILMEWVRELTPMDVADFEFPLDPVTGLVQLRLKESNGNIVSAYSASDGTLRFLAMLASLLGKQPARLYFFEEIDNGIHPTRLRLLLDLIERQTEKGNIQVVTTTHSPDLLSMVADSTFQSTSVVFRPPGSDAAIIARIADLPNAAELRESQGLGRLHASGWMEDMLVLSDPDAIAAAQ
jgi:predicted ATPase